MTKPRAREAAYQPWSRTGIQRARGLWLRSTCHALTVPPLRMVLTLMRSTLLSPR